ncbi:MAG: hypothetical protein ABS95_01485 [Verrucomicrobia bacterium SCN 57-15]|nr:MAG: hypothetical protein ABS95_01485 [Verrucomicrobia bacterium SCN 57-15]
MIILADKFKLLDNLEIPATSGGVNINGSFVTEIAEYLRGSEIEVFDRGNDRTEISFSTTRLHASVSAAEKFCMEHRDTVPRRCLVTLISDYDEARVERYLINACVAEANSKTAGATSFHSYRIIGGKIKTKKQ